MLPCFVFPPNLQNSFVLRCLGLMGVGEGHLRYEEAPPRGPEREADSDRNGTETSSSSSGTIEVPDGVTTSYEEVPNATALRRCRAQ
jgi:hypothetical protein